MPGRSGCEQIAQTQCCSEHCLWMRPQEHMLACTLMLPAATTCLHALFQGVAS